MSLPKQQSFDDAELDRLAIEIIKDLSTKPQIDPNDAFICKLAEEIEIEILNLHDLPSSSNYTDTSLYPLPSTVSSSTPNNTIAAMSPIILSRYQLSPNDSLNQSFPPIPSPKSHHNKASQFKFPTNKKRPVSTYNYKKRYKTNSFSPNIYPIPRYHAPPHISLAQYVSKSSDYTLSPSITHSDISSCISPRNLTPKSRVSVIPDFITDTVPIHRTKKKKKKKKPTIDTYNIRNNVSTQKRSLTPTARAKRRRRHKRGTNSNVLTRSEMEQYNEYAVEVDDGFIFINSYNILNDVV